jgi:hypothetical protein
MTVARFVLGLTYVAATLVGVWGGFQVFDLLTK